MSQIRIYEDPIARVVRVQRGTLGSFPYNTLRAQAGDVTDSVSIMNLIKEYPDGSEFLEVRDTNYANFVNEGGVAWGSDVTTTVNALNAFLNDSGTPSGDPPEFTSSMAVSLTEGNTLNYELTATSAMEFEWSNLPSGVVPRAGNNRILIGGSSLAVGTYNIDIKAINMNGETTDTLVLTVAAPPYSNTKSVKFERNDMLSGFASDVPALSRPGSGAGSSDAWTIAMWFKAGTSGNPNQTILYYGSLDYVNNNCLRIVYNGHNTQKRILMKYGSDNNYLELKTPIASIGTGWHHIMITYDGGTTGASSGSISSYYGRFEIFIDGVSQSTTNTNGNYGITSAMSSSGFLIGASTQSNRTLRNSCKIDELAIWDTDETANVAAIYNSGNTHDLSALGSSPDNYWRMGDGDTYPVIQDTVGTADLLMMNMVATDIVSDVP